MRSAPTPAAAAADVYRRRGLLQLAPGGDARGQADGIVEGHVVQQAGIAQLQLHLVAPRAEPHRRLQHRPQLSIEIAGSEELLVSTVTAPMTLSFAAIAADTRKSPSAERRANDAPWWPAGRYGKSLTKPSSNEL